MPRGPIPPASCSRYAPLSSRALYSLQLLRPARFKVSGGIRRYSYFVPDGMRRETERKLLVVWGEDIGEYALQGYQNGPAALRKPPA